MLELNKIYNMDCLEGMKLLDDNSMDLVVTDPPYNFSCSGGLSGGGIAAKKQIFKNIHNSFGSNFNPTEFLNEVNRISKNGHIYIFCNKELIYPYLDWAKNNRYSFDILILNKINPLPIKQNHYLPSVEYCIFIRGKNCIFNNTLPFDYYKKVQSYIVGLESNGHPTPKPISLIRQYILISSDQDHIILDPFMGSGTTAVACKQLNRNFIGFEISKEYCDIANKRLEQENIQKWSTLCQNKP